jgi:hypothetical protein
VSAASSAQVCLHVDPPPPPPPPPPHTHTLPSPRLLQGVSPLRTEYVPVTPPPAATAAAPFPLIIVAAAGGGALLLAACCALLVCLLLLRRRRGPQKEQTGAKAPVTSRGGGQGQGARGGAASAGSSGDGVIEYINVSFVARGAPPLPLTPRPPPRTRPAVAALPGALGGHSPARAAGAAATSTVNALHFAAGAAAAARLPRGHGRTNSPGGTGSLTPASASGGHSARKNFAALPASGTTAAAAGGVAGAAGPITARRHGAAAAPSPLSHVNRRRGGSSSSSSSSWKRPAAAAVLPLAVPVPAESPAAATDTPLSQPAPTAVGEHTHSVSDRPTLELPVTDSAESESEGPVPEPCSSNPVTPLSRSPSSAVRVNPAAQAAAAAASSVPGGRARGSLEPGVVLRSWRSNPLHASAKDPRRQQQPGSSRYVLNPPHAVAAAPVSAPSLSDPALSESAAHWQAAPARAASTLESLRSPDHVWRSNPLRAPPGSARSLRVAGAGDGASGSAKSAREVVVADRGVSANTGIAGTGSQSVV